ncbi:MAG TPA: hypothetical protein VFQ58_04790 [Flavisolibacter sp.]|jgi:hypothetical protein|nr:hypothetical protein [Flavisolibacter sp.]
MKLSDFILLDEEQKKVTVLHQGVLIGKRNTNESLVFLFQMDSYYVESYCNRANKAIEEFRIFTNLKPLHPYLEAIPLDDLLN